MFKGIKKAVGARFNVKKWMGYDQLKDSARFIGSAYKDIAPKKDNERQRRMRSNISFEEMMQINQLTEDDIRKGVKQQRTASTIFCCVALIPFAYACYLFSLGIILGGIVSFLGSVLCLAYAYRFRVGMYQYRYRVMKIDPLLVLKDWLSLKK